MSHKRKRARRPWTWLDHPQVADIPLSANEKSKLLARFVLKDTLLPLIEKGRPGSE